MLLHLDRASCFHLPVLIVQMLGVAFHPALASKQISAFPKIGADTFLKKITLMVKFKVL